MSVIERLHGIVRSVRRSAVAGLGDAALLERFVTNRDEVAFEELVHLHGPMVLGVCQRILGNRADAEDAFQATFVILSRKAGSVRPGSMVGNWLFGVARNAALKAKAMTNNRRQKERAAAEAKGTPVAHQDLAEMHAMLDEELGRLPEKYRSVVVFCELEGRSVKDVAGQLRLPQGTVASRLSRGRALLGKRLQKRAVAFTAAGVAALLPVASAHASVSGALLHATVEAALAQSAGRAAALVTANVLSITESVMRSMFLAQLKTWTVVALSVIGMFAAGLGVHSRLTEDGPEPATVLASPAAPAKAAEPLMDPAKAAHAPLVLRVKWLRPGPEDWFEKANAQQGNKAPGGKRAMGNAGRNIAMEEVQILNVLKNTTGEEFGKTLLVGRANLKDDLNLPKEECTIYVQRYEVRTVRIWILVSLNLQRYAVSHTAIAKPEPEAKK